MIPLIVKGPDYSTSEKRIAAVAWRWNSQYSYRAEWLAKGFTEDEIDAGHSLGAQMADERRGNYAYYGDPAYGSWNLSAEESRKAQPIRHKILDMMKERTETNG